MKITKLCLLVGVFLCVIPARAQVYDFDLSKYKLTDVDFRSWDNSLYFNRRSQDQYNINENTTKVRSHQLDLDYEGTFRIYQNTRPKQRELTLNLTFEGDRDQSETIGPETERKSYFWRPSVVFRDVHRFYHNHNVYVEWGGLIAYQFYQSHFFDKNSTSTQRTSSDDHLMSLGMPVKVGKGRLERVEDARQALYLLQFLDKKNRLKSDMAEEEILELSTFVSKLRNKRFFDTRLQRIYQLEKLDSFFQSHNLSNEYDAKYFSTMMDYWMFGGQPIRYSGSRINLAFYPLAGHRDLIDAQVGTIRNSNFQYIFQYGQFFSGLEYWWEKPINQKWQSSLISSLYVGRRKTTTNYEFLDQNDMSEVILPGYQFQLNYMLGFYPTTRTSLTWQTTLEHDRVTESTSTDISSSYDFKQSIVSSVLNATYYVSPRFRINGSFTWRMALEKPGPDFTRGFVLSALPIERSYFDPTAPIGKVTNIYYYSQRKKMTYLDLKVTYALF